MVFIHAVILTAFLRTHPTYEQRRHAVMLLHGGIVIGINLRRPSSLPPHHQDRLSNELALKGCEQDSKNSNIIYL